MLINTTFKANNLGLNKEDERLDISCGGDLKVVVTVERDKTDGNFIWTARGDATPSAKLAADLTNDPNTTRAIKYLTETEARLFYDYLRRTIRLLMWRRGTRVDYSLPFAREASWSLDGQQWNPIPFYVAGLTLLVDMPVNQGPVPHEAIADVGTLVESGQDEPLAHQLLREAWSQKFGSPPASLVFAIMAAEVGFKHCVSSLVPGASWLVENLQTPPLYRMLKEYLPLLPVKLHLKGKTLVPPDELLDEIRTGNDLRNKVSHQGHVEITVEKLHRILKAVSDLLWILDFYQGHEWAIHHVQLGVLTAWKSNADKS